MDGGEKKDDLGSVLVQFLAELQTGPVWVCRLDGNRSRLHIILQLPILC